jgi:DNA-binding response OmpR family regulator
VLAAGQLTFDPATRQCHKDGRPVPLTAREAGLLEYLMRHPDEVLSKTDILTHVWDAHYEGDPNIVEVYVSYLRKKIDAPFGYKNIETVRGAGYRLHGRPGQ